MPSRFAFIHASRLSESRRRRVGKYQVMRHAIGPNVATSRFPIDAMVWRYAAVLVVLVSRAFAAQCVRLFGCKPRFGSGSVTVTT